VCLNTVAPNTQYACAIVAKDGQPGPAVTITPYNAGHLLGGCVWRVVAGYADGRGGGGQAGSNSEEEVVYAVDWCHKKERCVRERVCVCVCVSFVPCLTAASNQLPQQISPQVPIYRRHLASCTLSDPPSFTHARMPDFNSDPTNPYLSQAPCILHAV
jgi:hypothetical protein